MKQYDDTNLPKVNTNENLETISSNFFRPLLDVNKFEIRSETVRDKGIDFHIELKKEQSNGDSVYTNFRFAVQLKATESIEANTDGSFSIQIDSSNINYLLNNGMPSFYVFYHKPTHMFYYESANNFFAELQRKNAGWNKQEKHSLRFSKILDNGALSEMYQETFEKGILFRQLNHHLKFNVPEDKQGGIIIDTENEIYSVAENMIYLDQFGPELINGQHFNFIIEIEQRTYPRLEAPPRFNLVCGIAYFQTGNLYKAIELLKLAQQKSETFEQDIQAMLTYTLLNAKFLLGIISKDDFEKELSKITDDQDSGTFFEIEKAYNEISSNKVKPADGIMTLYTAINDIIKKDTKNSHMRITAYAKILNAEAVILFHELEMNCTYLIGRVKEPLKSQTYLEWMQLETTYLKRLDELLNFAMENQYFLAVSNLASSKIRWSYKRIFYTHLLNNWKKNKFDLIMPLNAEDLEILTKGCEKLDKIVGTYEMLEHKENMISCLNNKYEILHFLGRSEEVELIKTKIFEIIEANDFVGLKAQYNEMINGKTPHEKFIKDYTERINGIQKLIKKIGVPFYKESEELFLKRKPEWSIDRFFEFDFIKNETAN
jgi:uncharacterized protein DUF4365